jgi:CheY-like chemotaxis protein
LAKTVLVVDDDPDFRELMADVLEAQGYHVAPCPVATEAFRMAGELRSDAIIVDLVMPGFSGWQVIE